MGDDVAKRASVLLALLRDRSPILGMEPPTEARLEDLRTTNFDASIRRTKDVRARLQLGLIWPMVLARQASRTGSPRSLDDALFRFGHHLRESATAAVGVPERRALSHAGAMVFEALIHPPAPALNQLRALAPGGSSNDDWMRYVGFDRRQLRAALPTAESTANRSSSDAGLATPADEHSNTELGWLRLPRIVGTINKSMLSTANWREPATGEYSPEEAEEAIRRAHTAYGSNDHEEAARLIRPALLTAGINWSPTEAPDATRLWNWLRLVVLLAKMASRERPYEHLDRLSAIELALRIDEHAIIDGLVGPLLEGTRAGPMPFTRTNLIARVRLLILLGREVALGDLTNELKAQFRTECATAVKRADIDPRMSTFELESTLRQFAYSVESDFREASEGGLAEIDRRTVTPLVSLADDQERRLLQDFLFVLASYQSMSGSPERDVSDLSDLEYRMSELQSELRNAGSLWLQEKLLPPLAQGLEQIASEKAAIAQQSLPEIVLSPETHTLPPRGSKLDAYGLSFWLRNTGNALARDITFAVTGSNLPLDRQEPKHLHRIREGGEEQVSVRIASQSPIPEDVVELEYELSWRDDYGQSFASQGRWRLEPEQDAGWSIVEPNPFSLNSIARPDRLVGREDLVESLASTFLSGESVYVTGMKRVGKSSVIQVVEHLIGDERTATVYFALGFAGLTTGHDLINSIVQYLDEGLRARFDVPPAPQPSLSENTVQRAGAWLREVGRSLGEHQRCVLAIDDFDELPPVFFKGQDADNLFRFLRGLVGERWLSVVLVGSEVLPSIIAEQSHRLNQVSPVRVENLSNAESVANLLRKPSEHRLRWDDTAVASVFALSSGNPYYATLLARQIWARMREQRRASVQQFDVNDAAAVVAEESEENQFVHLWADDPKGIEPSSRRALLSSALLRGLANALPDCFGSAAPDQVTQMAQGWVVDATASELGDYLDRLISRGVIRLLDGHRLAFSIPLAAIWFRAGGTRKLDAWYERASLARVQRYVISAGDYVRLAHEITYCGRDLTATDLQAWVEQIGPDPHLRYLAMQILRRVLEEGYFSSDTVQRQLLPSMREELFRGETGLIEVKRGNYTKNVIVVAPDDHSSSAASLIGPLVKTFRIPKHDVVSVDDVSSRIRGSGHYLLLVADDFVGTGTQIGKRALKLHDALQDLPDLAERISIVASVAVAADADLLTKAVRKVGGRAYVSRVVGPRLRAFDVDAAVFDSEGERRLAQDLFSAVGRSLGADPELGFGNQGLLVVFEHNCPNNALPALWRNGAYQGRKWIPIFPRRR